MKRRALAALALVLASPILPAMSAEEATLWGYVLDSTGRPVPGVRVLIAEDAARSLFMSLPAGAAGEYSLVVPVNGRYRLVGALAPDGRRIEVWESPPIAMAAPARFRLDAHLRPKVEPAAARPPASPQKPWYKRPAGITALVAVHAAALAVLLSGRGEGPASPSQPGP